MDLIVSICLNAPAFDGSDGPAEAARRLRQLAGEIEANVRDFSACAEGQRIAGSPDDCSCIAYLADL
ncbi:cell division protein ZapA [Cupriavidus sp. IK-TO18]|uniref:cell division protein ZapA n=1 Tax=Cupriavidus sp. IK-TO18 TaxID=2782182 RepID=UPI00189A2B0A|nr:cell division protein ZapA [Cupriavidus sp. IK-TO18]MBF6989319.1 cell division protein ZapA [Cupriavidus sp. IK-TO18]